MAISKIFRRGACLTLSAVLMASGTAALADSSLTTARVNLRTGATTSASVIKTLDKSVTVSVLAYDADGWSKINVDGKEGYIKSEFMTAPTADAAVEAPADTAEADVFRTSARVNLRTGPSLSDSVIKTLNAGVTVEMLAYDAANWSQVSVNGQTGYIKSEYLIKSAGYAAALAENGVELTPWSEAKKIFTTYTPAQVYDVRTGAVYFVQSFSNGNHADVEPLTKEDTAILLQTYGGKWQWAPRPVWVTINGHTMAASINGMPHGGGVIDDNGMDGQICIHFLGSKTHNGNSSFAKRHQDGVMEAWAARNQ